MMDKRREDFIARCCANASHIENNQSLRECVVSVATALPPPTPPPLPSTSSAMQHGFTSVCHAFLVSCGEAVLPVAAVHELLTCFHDRSLSIQVTVRATTPAYAAHVRIRESTSVPGCPLSIAQDCISSCDQSTFVRCVRSTPI
jgi:hypothetical protein